MIQSHRLSELLILSAIAVVSGLCFELPAFARSAKPAEASPAPVSKPDDPGCRNCVSESASLFARGEAKEAINNLRQWSPRCPNSARLHLLFSTILLSTGASEEAERESAAAAALSPSLLAAHLQHALALMALDKKFQAIKEYERCTEIDPTCYEAWTALASVYRQLHDDEKAAGAAAKAADLDPSTRQQKMSTLLNLKKTKRFDEAKIELKRLLDAKTTTPEFAGDLAREAISIGAFDDAVSAANKALAAHPQSAAQLMTSALANFCLNNFTACLDDTSRLAELDPNNLDSLSLKSLALVKTSRVDEAEQTLASASGDKNSTMYLLAKGYLESARDHLQPAEQALVACLDYDQGNNALQGVPHTMAHLALADIYKRMGKSAQAAEQTQAVAKDKRFASNLK